MIESRQPLRPVERLVLRLVAEGVADIEIARRFRRSPEMIHRIATMARLPRTAGARVVSDDGLRPLERRLLRWRHYGATYAEIGSRFRHSPAFVARVEALAHYKLEDRRSSDPPRGAQGASLTSAGSPTSASRTSCGAGFTPSVG
jgi:DNA-binding CsgD family transcriptional regulator